MSDVIAIPEAAEKAEAESLGEGLSGVAAARSPGVWLGPATVIEAGYSGVDLRLPMGRRVRAQLALGYPYEPAVGDVVLGIGNADGHWIIGVVSGKGRATLKVEGDLDVHATGTLRLHGERAVELTGPEINVTARKLTTLADTVVSAVGHLRQRITELWSVHAAERHTVIEGTSHEQAKTATVLTEEKMTINGKAIYLG